MEPFAYRNEEGTLYSPDFQANVDFTDRKPWEPLYLVSKDEMERDEYHTMKELYHYRMLYHAMFVNLLEQIEKQIRPLTKEKPSTVKSKKHHDGDLCFGGGWFIVVTDLPTGQISNHYKEEFWDLFNVPAVDLPPVYDGHSPTVAANRMENFVKDYQ